MAGFIVHKLRRLLVKFKNKFPVADYVPQRRPILDMFYCNWYLGLTSFGGPAVHFQIFHKLFVEDKQWLQEQTYQEMFALCQSLPGPGSTKMLYAINVDHYGFCLGLLSFFIWSLPMAIAAFGLSVGIAKIGEVLPGVVYALLSGLNAGTVGIVALAAVQLSQKAVTDKLTCILVFFGATAGMLYNSLWYFPVLMVVGGAATTVWDFKLLQKFWKAVRLMDAVGNDVETADEGNTNHENIELQSQASLESPETHRRLPVSIAEGNEDGQTPPRPASMMCSSPTAHDGPLQNPSGSSLKSWKVGSMIVGGFFATFVVIVVLRGTGSGGSRGFDLFANLYLAGTIIFGGGPVVIPLLREYVVAEGWVSSRNFLLGLAIIQAFPGPNFNFAVYLGSLAVVSSQIPMAAGAIIGFVAIFAPGLTLHTGTIGLWQSFRKIHAMRSCLRGVHAAAVGFIYTAVYRLFEIGYLDADFRDGRSLGQEPWWVVVAVTCFVGGMWFKLSPPLAIVLGAIMGLI